MENKSASCPSDHLPRRGVVQICVNEANIRANSQSQPSTSTSSQLPRIFTPEPHGNIQPLTAWKTSHPCERHGMAVESYSVLAFSPCATAKKPASRCHASPSRTTDDLECDFFMLELLLYHALLRHWSCWGESTCIALQSRVHQQLAICCAYPWVSCERHRTAYAGPSEGTLRRYVDLPGQPDVFLEHQLNCICCLLCIVPIPSILALALETNDHFLKLFTLPTADQFPHNATLSLSIRAT